MHSRNLLTWQIPTDAGTEGRRRRLCLQSATSRRSRRCPGVQNALAVGTTELFPAWKATNASAAGGSVAAPAACWWWRGSGSWLHRWPWGGSKQRRGGERRAKSGPRAGPGAQTAAATTTRWLLVVKAIIKKTDCDIKQKETFNFLGGQSFDFLSSVMKLSFKRETQIPRRLLLCNYFIRHLYKAVKYVCAHLCPFSVSLALYKFMPEQLFSVVVTEE